MKRKIYCIILLGLLFGIFFVSPVYAVEDADVWNLEIGDTLEWRLVDDYYLFEDPYVTEGVSESNRYQDATEDHIVIMDYEYVKEWGLGDLTLNITASDPQVTTVQVIVEYIQLGGGLTVERNFTDYESEWIYTIIPLYLPVFLDEDYEELYEYLYDKDVDIFINGSSMILVNETNYIPSSLAYGTMGVVTINLFNDTYATNYSYMYTFHVISNTDQEKTPFREYNCTGLQLEVVNKKDYTQDLDEYFDLLVMAEDFVSVDTPIGDVKTSIPQLIDISTILGTISLVVQALTLLGSDEIDLPFPLGLGFPTGMTVIYSDTSRVIDAVITNSPDFVSTMISTILEGGNLTLDPLFESLDEYSESYLFNALLLISSLNLFVFPKTTDFEKMGETIDLIGNLIETFDFSELFAFIDLSNIIYGLENLFTYRTYDDIFEIRIGGSALPMLFDAHNGMASIELRVGWNTTSCNLDHIEFEVDFPMNEFGHIMGLRFGGKNVENIVNPDDTDSDDPWTKQLTDLLLLFGSIFGFAFSLLVVKRKKDSRFKKMFNGFVPTEN